MARVDAGGPPTVELTQRRFFADPGAAATVGDGAATKWLVPVVLRFRDLKGVKEQPVLLREASARVKLEAEGLVEWCIGNADARGFYRTNYDDATLARLLPAVGELRPAERIALISDQWALVRADQAPIERFLDLVVSLRGEEDHVVLDEVVGRLGLIEHRFLADEDRGAFGALVTKLYGERAAKLGWSPAATEDDETRLRRAVLLRALIITARDPNAIAEAERRLPAAGAGAGDVDPNLLDVVVTAAARRASEPRFEDLRARVKSETDPASKRRYLHALARAEEGRLPARAVSLALSDEVPMQDFSSFMSVLLSNRATREEAFAMIRDRWTETRAKADSPMIVRRLVEAMAALPERRHYEAVRAFLEAHPIDGAKQAIAQTLERMKMDATLRDRILPRISAWLRARR